jgi:cell wall-associated NlpC family hydrolase
MPTMHHGLTPEERVRARRLIKFAAVAAVSHKDEIHYTQGPPRWQGIDKKIRCYPGTVRYPTQADCSAFVTWLYWNALKSHINKGFPDILNGARWQAGYTGTLLQHGRVLHSGVPALVGDLVIYGSGGTGKHVAVYIGNGMVASHGSEAAPLILPWNYRKDIQSVRRYL